MVLLAIKKLHDIGIYVISLTSDGPSCHFSMMSALGASLDPRNMKAYFNHPMDRSKKVYVILDVCHMLKLVRITLGDKRNLVDENGCIIKWDYIAALENLQAKEGLRFLYFNLFYPFKIQIPNFKLLSIDNMQSKTFVKSEN